MRRFDQSYTSNAFLKSETRTSIILPTPLAYASDVSGFGLPGPVDHQLMIA